MTDPLFSEIAVAVLALGGGILSNAFFYGKLTQKVTDHAEQLKSVAEEQDDQWKRINNHETRISRLEGTHKPNGRAY